MGANKVVLGLCATRAVAEGIVVDLQQNGFADIDISVLMADKGGIRDVAYNRETKAPEGASVGAGTGGVVGGVLGLLAGIGALAIPGLGPFIAAGPIMATLGGVAAGAAVGGITGTLIGLGIPEFEARHYEGKITGGNILLAVHVEAPERRKLAKQILERNGATDVAVSGESNVPKDRTPVAGR
jgi:hypothetical protein